jgi:hypothetical protein
MKARVRCGHRPLIILALEPVVNALRHLEPRRNIHAKRLFINETVRLRRIGFAAISSAAASE